MKQMESVTTSNVAASCEKGHFVCMHATEEK